MMASWCVKRKREGEDARFIYTKSGLGESESRYGRSSEQMDHARLLVLLRKTWNLSHKSSIHADWNTQLDTINEDVVAEKDVSMFVVGLVEVLEIQRKRKLGH